jgi:hypothetical protein
VVRFKRRKEKVGFDIGKNGTFAVALICTLYLSRTTIPCDRKEPTLCKRRGNLEDEFDNCQCVACNSYVFGVTVHANLLG